MAGVKAEHIPYSGSGPALTALLGGEYHFNFAGMQASGDSSARGQAARPRGDDAEACPRMPDIPAVSEALPGFEVVGWYGVMGPPNMPKPLVTKLHKEIIAILKRPDTVERIRADGSEPVGSSPEEFRKFLLADMEKWAKVVKQSGAKVN